MWLTPRQPEARPSPRQMLDAVPVKNRAVRVERHGEELRLFVPLRRSWFHRPPVSWLLPVKTERGVALDRLGREVWQACDGRRSVEQIAQRLAERYHLRFHEARASVMQFLQELTRRGVVVVVAPRQPADARADTADPEVTPA